MNEENRVVVTGIGVIAANGNNKEEFYENCVNGISGIKECTIFDTSKLCTDYVGEIEKKLTYEPGKDYEDDRITEILRIAISEMFEDAKLTPDDIRECDNRAYLSLATSLAGNSRVLRFVREQAKGNFEVESILQSADFVSWIKNLCKIKGGCYTTMSACAAGSTAAGIGFDLIKEGTADLVVVGGADPLTEFSCMGFHALKSLSADVCKPFDENRDGINIGEAGAFMIFETLENAKKRNAHIYGEILGYGINNDAYHITSPDPNGTGAIASMKMAINEAGLEPKDIDYVNAHGTGTRLNDKLEMYAVDSVMNNREDDVAVSSTKSMTAHCLGAAGALELVATLLSIEHQRCMPTCTLEETMEEYKDSFLPNKSVEHNINYALSNSFAFAGNTASILVGKVEE